MREHLRQFPGNYRIKEEDRSNKTPLSTVQLLATVPLLIIDDLGMRKLPSTAAEDSLEIVMRRYERASTLMTSNRPVEDWGKLLGDSTAVSAMLDRLLTTVMSLNAVRAVGEPKWTYLTRRQKAKTTIVSNASPLAGFAVIINGRF